MYKAIFGLDLGLGLAVEAYILASAEVETIMTRPRTILRG